MTDEQIIEALECCAKNIRCDECPLKGIKNCMGELYIKSFDLIKRQQEEIESLEADYENVYKQAAADLLASIADGGTSCEWCIDKHRTEAVREFAERMKEKLDISCEGYSTEEVIRNIFDIIDDIVWEMTEKEGGKG